MTVYFYVANINFIYFILLFEHYLNFKLKEVVCIVALRNAYYGCNVRHKTPF
ncbi:hypothetical protein N643_17910 [Salmonella bongori serovar 48:z41:-- str. RKS3044]|nr:hypothetical protein N643_17910 [Salmonella bongori serovar 48:z41:-- str. RKS3044]